MDIELTTLLFRSLLIQNKRGCVQSQSLRSTQFGALDNIYILVLYVLTLQWKYSVPGFTFPSACTKLEK